MRADLHVLAELGLPVRAVELDTQDGGRGLSYIRANDIPYNPLHDVGYRSTGCIPCTRPTRPDEGERAGRWASSDKIECGIHLDALEGGR